MTPLHQLTIASRVFCIAAILGVGIVARDIQAIVSLILVATIAMTAVYVSLTTPLAVSVVVTVEAAITGLIIGLALPAGVVFLPYLVVLTLVAGLSRGVVGVSAVIAAQFMMITLVTVTWAPTLGRDELLRILSPWLLTSIGAGLLGAWLRRIGIVPRDADRDTSYESAHRLLTQLRTIARRLSSGLDPIAIATHIRDDANSSTLAVHSAVFVRTDGGVLSPLIYSGDAARESLPTSHNVIDRCWVEAKPIVNTSDGGDNAYLAAFPLRVGSRLMGVVLAQLPVVPSADTLKALMRRLDEHSVRLDTALAFDEIRSIATMEERNRLAREIHDGIAQEVASIGYVVDDLLIEADSAHQQAGLRLLRQELSRVVSELRLSIYDLRSASLRETGLGTALSEYVREVGTRSTMTVHLSLDEGPTRLRGEIEVELLRIAQEAITNARKHSEAKNLWVHCQVDPPVAMLEVRDDGSGQVESRPDSYGLCIMKERAQRLNARLDIMAVHDRAGKRTGTTVRVALGDLPENTSHTESEWADDASGPQDRFAGG